MKSLKLNSKSLLSLLVIGFLTSCGGSGGSNEKLLILDYSLVNEDDQLLQEAENNIAIQENSESFFEQNKGVWNGVDQEMAEAGASATFNFISKNELKIEMIGDVPNFGRARIINTAPYLIEKVPVVGNQLGQFNLLIKTITCRDVIEKQNERLLCGTAEVQRLEVLNNNGQFLQLRDQSNGEVLLLKR